MIIIVAAVLLLIGITASYLFLFALAINICTPGAWLCPSSTDATTIALSLIIANWACVSVFWITLTTRKEEKPKILGSPTR